MQPEKAFPGLWIRCAECGNRNPETEPRCERCGRKITEASNPPASADATGSSNHLLITGRAHAITSRQKRGGMAKGSYISPQLRKHLEDRVKHFRNRRTNLSLPFSQAEEASNEEKVVPISEEAPRREVTNVRQKARRTAAEAERQPDLDFPKAPMVNGFALPAVAPLRVRIISCGLDLGLVLVGISIFLLAAKFIAGTIELNRTMLYAGAGGAAVVALCYAWTFLYLAGESPAMKWMGLRVVNFDGRNATQRQKFWRLTGIAVSAGSLGMGYIWAAFDEEGLFWHDRISKTFLTTKSLTPAKK